MIIKTTCRQINLLRIILVRINDEYFAIINSRYIHKIHQMWDRDNVCKNICIELFLCHVWTAKIFWVVTLMNEL